MYKNIISQSGFSMDRLANFCAVADAGSIVGAAKGNTVLQTLISRQIRELEGLFGVELIRRRGRGLELTDAGRELATVGRENFKGLDDYAARCSGAAWTVRMVASN
ncbi:MAG: LysR family transcriptional regulator, partial [Verrucomicrobiales bacterium]